MSAQLQHQQELWPPLLPFPVKSGFLRTTTGEKTSVKTTSTPLKPSGRKVGARCRIAGCRGRPWFAQPGSRIPKACKDHKIEGEVNIYTPTCEVNGCRTRPHYGMEGERARFCCTHKLDGMVDVLNKRCASAGCRRQPSWARKRGSRTLFCKEHKDDNMVDIKHKACLHPGCTRFPSKSALAVATTTSTHSHPPSAPPARNTTATGSLVSTGDEFVDDGATPASSGSGSFEVPGPARYCALHAPVGAVNVTARRCRHPGGCSVQPYFGREGGGHQAEFCTRHKKRGMTDVRNPRCGATGCTAQPCCGREGDPRPLFCLRHAEPDMVNFRSEGYRESAPKKRSKVSKPSASKRQLNHGDV